MKAVTTEQIRQLDQQTISLGTPGEELMERAGYAVARAAMKVLRRLDARSVLLFAGKGNNGGDAIVAARHLAAAGCEAALVLLCKRTELQGDPLIHFQKLVAAVKVLELPTLEELAEVVGELEPAVVVDGLLGTGLKGEVREPYVTAIKVINGLHRPVVAVDIPSGLDSDTGEVLGVAVRAQTTLTMGLPKIGLLKPAALEFVGRIEVVDIGIPRKLLEHLQSDVELVTARDVAALLPTRARAAHKGDFGHLLIIAGSEGYTGAPVLTATAAARAGAGLVTLAVPRSVYRIVAAKCPPEVMPRPADFDTLDTTDFAGFNAIAIGPGLGQDPRTQRMIWKVVSGWMPPIVADADALNAMAPGVAALKKLHKPLVVTPHPGEMGRLISKTSADVQANRWDIAREFAKDYGVTTVLKGAGTLIAEKGQPTWVNMTGNPGMAKGGMGDALTGIIGAFLAQGMTPAEAARAGVFLHGLAGDLASEAVGERALLTSDLIGKLGAAFAALDETRG
ncbi:MAG TPA: NAD(P)H-hydrate dehydratase [Verrucomicrobiae bacterium]|nr:NAD(P)H-hydrate dehydratase [Verrucomicrobiae bacterium]